MSRTEFSIIHCDGCGDTASSEEAYDDGHWFRLEQYGYGGMEYDYCSGKCLFAHAGVHMPDRSA